MSGISTGIGIFSGIDTATLIEQLLAIEARPKLLAQQRLSQLRLQQTAYMEVNSKLGAFKDAAAVFRLDRPFDAMMAASSDESILTAVASKGAAAGSYSFIVHRLVSSQQLLSRGFADANTTGLGAESFTFESYQARLDRDTALSELFGGTGVRRGKVVINDGASSATVDLSRAVSVNDVLSAINGAGLNVAAEIEGDKLVIRHTTGGSVSIADAAGYAMASDLGIVGAGAAVESADLHFLSTDTALATVNDGNGVFIGNQQGNAAYDFSVWVDGIEVRVNIGEIWDYVPDPDDPDQQNYEMIETAAASVGDVIDRINAAVTAAAADNPQLADVSAAIGADGGRLVITDAAGTKQIEVTDNTATAGNTAADLGIATSGAVTGQVTGARILATLNSTLGSSLNGGSGVTGDGQIFITLRDGSSFSVTLDPDESVAQIMEAIGASGGTMPDGTAKFGVSLNETGTGLKITDHTGGTGNLIITGTADNDTAASLGISTGAAGVAADSFSGSNTQHRYITQSTVLSTLNNGAGVGTGEFTIVDSTGMVGRINIGSDDTRIGDVIAEINSAGTLVRARINATGDGIELYEDSPDSGTLAIRVEDQTGSVASRLNIEGEAADPLTDNTIDGTFERVVTFDATDTLRDIADAINDAGIGVAASIINDGSSSTPFRLNLASTRTGADGRFIMDAGSFNLGQTTLTEGRDAVAFFGADDPANAVLLTSSSNTLDEAISGVSIDLHSASNTPVTLTVTPDTSAVETAIEEFVAAFNEVITRIDFHSRYDEETEARGALLGDGTLISLRNSLYAAINGEAQNISGSYTRLSQAGIKLGPGGTLEFDAEKFREALLDDPASVEQLFSAYVLDNPDQVEIGDGITVDYEGPDIFSSLGVPGQIEQLIKRYIDSVDGVLTYRNRALDGQIEVQNRRIEAFDEQLERKRARLEAQFVAMEQALAQLSVQQSALASLANGFTF